MPNITLAIPKELHAKMKHHSEMQWSEVMRKTLAEKLEMLDLLEKATKKSKRTKKDVDTIAQRISKEVFEGLNRR